MCLDILNLVKICVQCKMLLFGIILTFSLYSAVNGQYYENSTALDVMSYNTSLKVLLGDDITLSCTVRNLNDHKVIWFNPIGVAKLMYAGDNADQETDVRLDLHNVQLYDSGVYKCLVNTKPIQFLKIKLEVMGLVEYTTMPSVTSVAYSNETSNAYNGAGSQVTPTVDTQVTNVCIIIILLVLNTNASI